MRTNDAFPFENEAEEGNIQGIISHMSYPAMTKFLTVVDFFAYGFDIFFDTERQNQLTETLCYLNAMNI